jgi:hypothetical protein
MTSTKTSVEKLCAHYVVAYVDTDSTYDGETLTNGQNVTNARKPGKTSAAHFNVCEPKLKDERGDPTSTTKVEPKRYKYDDDEDKDTKERQPTDERHQMGNYGTWLKNEPSGREFEEEQMDQID